MSKARVIYSGGSPAELMTELIDATRAGVREAASFWDEHMLEEHFEPGAAAKYGYAKRSGEGEPAYVAGTRGIVLAGGRTKYGFNRVKPNPKYYWRKQREGFGKTALVRTGETRRMALSGGRIGSSVKGNIVEGFDAIPVPSDAFFKQPRGSAVDKAKELTTAIPVEEQQLAGVVETVAARRIDRGGGRRTKALK